MRPFSALLLSKETVQQSLCSQPPLENAFLNLLLQCLFMFVLAAGMKWLEYSRHKVIKIIFLSRVVCVSFSLV